MRFAQSILFSLFFLVTGTALAQERCGTVPYNQKLKERKQIPQSDLHFENWLKQKMHAQRIGRNQRKKTPPYKIPVVVHVIHKGEAEGTGTNISDVQILSQINVLNKDFNRLNTDANETPALFVPDAGSMDIEFVLAKQDPEGLPSDGIVRVKGSKNGWTANDNYELKSQSYWPSENYLNIWVCDLIDELVGYAQLPESTLLNGLENSSNNALTDGVVIWYKSFGSVDDGAFDLDPNFDKGRTVTHEVGHFFGLRHIWGDDSGSCSGTDYVDDTPNQSSSNTGCPTHPKSGGCSATSMFQNFLDYTDDECMNLFTQGQINRMQTVIENSPRRTSLLTSPGLQTPVPVANDLGIRQALSPLSTACSTLIIPELEVRNYGSNTITAAQIEVTVNGSSVETKDFALSLNGLESAIVSFAPLTVSTGNNTIVFTVMLTNGVADGKSANNNLTRSFFVSESIATPFSESFGTLPSEWVVQNPDQLVTWQLATAPKDTETNTALLLNFNEYEESYGEFDIVLSPVIDLSNVGAALLKFDVAHARYGSSNDRLKVIVLTNCEPLSSGTTIYDKWGDSLKTAASTSGFFVPSGPEEWRKESRKLTQFIGESQVQLAFVGINDWGNNLYLDNITFSTSQFEDLTLTGMISPSVVTCNTTLAPILLVQNGGTVPITNFKIEYSVNGETFEPHVLTGLNPADETMTVVMPALTLQEGSNSLTFKLTEPNGVADETPDDNEKVFSVIVNPSENRIPLRENFEDVFEPDWTLVSPSGGMNWETFENSANTNTYLYYNSYSNPTIGNDAWLVSPVLDFSGTSTASLVFDVSAGSLSGRSETLKILVSRDCGDTYAQDSLLQLNTIDSSDEWEPLNEDDWQKSIIDLNEFAGEEDIRIAIVVTNQNGNNVFVDNIEFFITDTPDTLEIEDRHTIYGYNAEDPSQNALKVTFNLSERQDVPYSVVDMLGKFQADGVLKDVLNQTYPLELEQKLRPGIYIVRMKIGGKYVADRVVIAE